MTGRLTPEQQAAALPLVDACFTAVEIAREIDRDAGSVYHWANRVAKVKLHGQDATATRLWLKRGGSVLWEPINFCGDDGIWVDPQRSEGHIFCSRYVQKLFELGKLELSPGSTAVYRLKDTQWVKVSSNAGRSSSPRPLSSRDII